MARQEKLVGDTWDATDENNALDEVVGDIEGGEGDDKGNIGRMVSRRLRDVMRYGMGWETSAVTPEPFTENYVFSARDELGNVYRIADVFTFASAVSTYRYARDCDSDPDMKERGAASLRFQEQFGHWPSSKQLEHYRSTGEYIIAK
jgi:hypothetical protein